VKARIQYNVDASARFYGFGPASLQSAQSNYRADFVQYTATLGAPLAKDSLWRAHLTDRLLSERIANGPIPGITSFDTLYGTLAPVHYQQTDEVRLTVDYDSRNHQVTTYDGDLLQLYAEKATRGLASEYSYGRFGLDARAFHPSYPKGRLVSCAQLSFEQVLGSAPFWLEPSLGGKYSLRSYGDGRFADRGMAAFNIEERYTFYQEKLADVQTEFEISPFAGAGTVFESPTAAQFKYLHPVFGAAVRAVARPQVVGSVDVAFGQEGLKVFTDINYSF
jgi:outer membrane protein assembly factor BamA